MEPGEQAYTPTEWVMLPHMQEHVQWVGVDWKRIILFALAWEVLYQLAKANLAQRCPQWPKIATLGGSYTAALVNAVVCSAAGLWIVSGLINADDRGRSLVLSTAPYESVTPVVFFAAQSFLGWLLMDLCHLILLYPRLGGVDQLLHHSGFFALTSLGYGYRVLPFAVGWLLLCEVSSIPLEIRWFLINTGGGESRALKLTNTAFALSFFCFRVLVVWMGIADMMRHSRPFLLEHGTPRWTVDTLCNGIIASAMLNLYWLVKIIQMARRPATMKERRPSDESSLVFERKREVRMSRESSTDALSDFVDSTPASPEAVGQWKV
jgi:hypothetical protein